MELFLKRTVKTDKSTIGEMSVGDVFECYILEDVERDVKIKGKTAIPKGRYKVEITMSARFKKLLPILVGVPNFEGVRIHPGNTAEDTEGCLLPGTSKGVDFVGSSKIAFGHLFDKITYSIENGKEVHLTIT